VGSVPVPSPTLTPAAAVSAPAGSPLPQPPTPAQQIVTVLAPLRSSPDGTHQVTIGLQPDGLGNVKATVTVSAEQVVVQLAADNDHARDALRQALPLLQHELAGDGSSATVLMSNEGHTARDHLSNQTAPSRPGSGADDNDDDPTATAPTVGSTARRGHVDLRL
jgi:flagellar hook-length control protein FliK